MTSAQWPQATRDTANDKLLQADAACTLNNSAIPRTRHKKTQAKRAHNLGHKATLKREEGSIEILSEHSKVTRSITQTVHVCAQNFQEESYRSAYPIAMRQ